LRAGARVGSLLGVFSAAGKAPMPRVGVAVLSVADLEALVKDLINRDAVTVPPYPGVAMKLQRLVGGGNYGMNDLAKTAMSDPVVTGYLLRAANSPAYRGSSKITSVGDAVMRMGGSDVVRIAIAASMGAEAGKKGVLATLRRRVWRESLISAVVSFQLATARKLNAQEGFVCGLLHDIGRVVAVSSLEILLAQRKDERMWSEADWLAFVDRFHVELGIVTCRKWSLSDVLQEVIAHHHDPVPSGPHKAMIDVVVASDAVVALMLREPAVTQQMLATLAGISPTEAIALFNAIPGIGPFVASMDEAAPAAVGPAVVSQVTPPPKPPDNAAKANFPITLIRANGTVDGRCYRAMRDGLTFILKERLPHGYLLRLQLRPPTTTAFEVHASVENCTPDPDGFEIAAKLFALGGPARDKWAEVITALGISEGSAATQAARA
jgi:HD-like signal output (HDOD) protein